MNALAHVPLAVQITVAVLGVAALSAGAVWASRTAARYLAGRGGQNWETVLLLGFFAAAAAQSAGGLLGFAKHNMHLALPMAVVFWLALDGAAGMLLSMIRRRARAGRSTWHVRLVVWLIIAASASFNWLHAPHMPAAPLAFAAMPVIAGILAEMAVADIKQEELEKARGSGWKFSRRVELARWLRPLESVRVMQAMSADPALPAAAATREVRAETAARALYRLRLAMNAARRGDSDATLKRARSQGLRIRIAEYRAQAAFRLAGFAAADVPTDILRRVQVLVRVPEFAILDYGNAEAAQNAIATLIAGEPRKAPEVPLPHPPNQDEETPNSGVVNLAVFGAKESAARKWWADNVNAGTDMNEVTGTQINIAAGASEKSSFGRTFKTRMLAEMNDGNAGTGAVTG